MVSKTNQFSVYDNLLCSNRNFQPLKADEIISLEKIARQESIAEKLANLPNIKAKSSFDQKMAAAFAMELEKETVQRNRSWLNRNSKIFLPKLLTNLKNDVL